MFCNIEARCGRTARRASIGPYLYRVRLSYKGESQSPGRAARRVVRTNRLPSKVAFCYTSCDGRSTREKKMRQAFMSIQRGITTYSKDMKLREYFEPWDRGACRRR